MKVPCKNCLLIPVCRHKAYNELVQDCGLALKYLRKTEDEIVNYPLKYFQSLRILNVERLLKPTKWQLGENE